jgi:hypothetical protein
MMRSSKNTLTTTLKKLGRLDKMIVFSVLIMLMIMTCDFVVMLFQELRRPIFLEAVFGLTLVNPTIAIVFSMLYIY